jgi:hypothetical protein
VNGSYPPKFQIVSKSKCFVSDRWMEAPRVRGASQRTFLASSPERQFVWAYCTSCCALFL